MPWNFEKKIYLRYYYFYDKKEFEYLLKEIGFRVIKIIDQDKPNGLYSQKNIIAIVQKPK